MLGVARIEAASNGIKLLSQKRCLGAIRIEGASDGVKSLSRKRCQGVARIEVASIGVWWAGVKIICHVHRNTCQ